MPGRKAKKVPPSGEEETMEGEEEAELSDDFRPGRAGRIEPIVEGEDDFGIEDDEDLDEGVIESESDEEEEEEEGETEGEPAKRKTRTSARRGASSKGARSRRSAKTVRKASSSSRPKAKG